MDTDPSAPAYATRQDVSELLQGYATRSDVQALRHEMSELRSELKLEMSELKSELKLEMSEHRSGIIRWMIGIFFGTFTVVGALLSLLLTGMYHLYGMLG